MAWTEERIIELKQLWAEGQSASKIAEKLGGVTRNAVIGKIHRLGLSNRVDSQDKPAVTNLRKLCFSEIRVSKFRVSL